MAIEPNINWPEVTRTMRPWTRWWWLGSAVDAPNLTRLLEDYQEAGLGGVEITPIYGVQGQEARDIRYLSAKWLAMLRHTIDEANRLDMGVDMPTGTGWPFGGPNVTDEDAEDKLVMEKTPLTPGHPLHVDLAAKRPQALVAVSAAGETVNLLDIASWTPPTGEWTLYTVTQKWAGRAVKRAAPGSEGKCINPFSRQSLMNYLERFDEAFADFPAGALRCVFHDSFEYLADWSPSLFEEFAVRRGYDLRDHLPVLSGEGDSEQSARVKTDYRETLSDLLLENFTQTWTAWAHGKGSLSRNQAHGSPGNLLDLYAAPDIPETEIFGGMGDPRINKIASSAAHVMGKPLVSSETCTWLAEHFTVSLGQCKAAIDRLFTAGINHIFYHGTPYSPADAAWPGWLFYASTTFAPSDPLWHDLPALNAYITRCQSLLQSGEPDNDVLLYWPLHDLWQKRPDVYMLEINGRWLADEPVGQTAQGLWDSGFSYDFVSDRQLGLAAATKDGIQMPGGLYKTIIVPPCSYMPLTTLETLSELASAGASVIYQDGPPSDVPGIANLSSRRQRFHALLSKRDWEESIPLQQALTSAGIHRETVVDHPGLRFVRRCHDDGHFYFFTHEGSEPLDSWVPLTVPFQSAMCMDALTGKVGAARVKPGQEGRTQIYLQLAPGASILVRTFTEHDAPGHAWEYVRPAGDPIALPGPWRVEFLEGGPELPPSYATETLGSWTESSEEAGRYAGTARYSTTFDCPAGDPDTFWLDLGQVCHSARVCVNGEAIGTLMAEPFRIRLPSLKTNGNRLEIEVTNLAANRISDMDRRGIPWRIFREINFVDIHYQPFDASAWPVQASGLLGPVRLVPMNSVAGD